MAAIFGGSGAGGQGGAFPQSQTAPAGRQAAARKMVEEAQAVESDRATASNIQAGTSLIGAIAGGIIGGYYGGPMGAIQGAGTGGAIGQNVGTMVSGVAAPKATKASDVAKAALGAGQNVAGIAKKAGLGEKKPDETAAPTADTTGPLFGKAGGAFDRTKQFAWSGETGPTTGYGR